MAIKIYEKFAPRANPADGDYPYGSIKNESVPGAKDGTPLDAAWANDYAGTDAELFAQAGIVPSGQPDKLGASQRVDALKAIFDFYGTVAEIASGKFNIGKRVSVTDRAGAVFLVEAGGSPNGSSILDAGNGNTAVLVEGQQLDQRVFGVSGAGYPVNDGSKLNAYADYCRANKLQLKLVSLGKKVKIYSTETLNFTGLDVIGDKPMAINFGAFVANDSYGFSILTGLPSGRPPASVVYAMDYRFSDKGGVCIFSDIANPVVEISSQRTHRGYGVSGWLEKANQNGMLHAYNPVYQGVRFPWRDIEVTGCGGDGIALKNGVELTYWKSVSSRQNYGYGVTTAGGGGVNNQEYFTAEECEFTANRLDGFLLSTFKKEVEFKKVIGNSNGWYGFGANSSLPKPGDRTFIRGMLRVEGNTLSSPNLRLIGCVSEDAARIATLQLNYPARGIEIENSYLIPTLNLASPSTDTTNHIIGLYPYSGGTVGQIYNLRMRNNFLQDPSRGKALTGTMSQSNIFDLDFDPRQEIDTGSYTLSDFSAFNVTTKRQFSEEITLSKHVQVGRATIGDGTAATFTTSYVNDNLRLTGQGNNSFSVGACFLITANWQSTNSSQGGAYLLYAFKLPSGDVMGEAIPIGAGSGFSSAPTIASTGVLSVPLLANFRGSITRIDMSGSRA